MGKSASAIICYGVMLDEDQEMPWDKLDDFEKWWACDVKGYKNPFQIFTDSGKEPNPKMDTPSEIVNGLRKHLWDFIRNNKPPLELITHSECERPMYIMAIKDTRKDADWGFPEGFEPDKLKVPIDEVVKLINFCRKYNIKYTGEPSWYLCSLWC